MKALELHCGNCERYIAQIQMINNQYKRTDKCYLCGESEHLRDQQ